MSLVLSSLSEALQMPAEALSEFSQVGDPIEWDSLSHLTLLDILAVKIPSLMEMAPSLGTADSVEELVAILDSLESQ